MSKVIQMIPAPNWTASFIDQATHIKGDARPLVCWALMEDGSVEGLVVDGNAVRPVNEMGQPFSSYHCHGSTHAM